MKTLFTQFKSIKNLRARSSNYQMTIDLKYTSNIDQIIPLTSARFDKATRLFSSQSKSIEKRLEELNIVLPKPGEPKVMIYEIPIFTLIKPRLKAEYLLNITFFLLH